MGEHEAAVERFVEATNLDQYLAVAYALLDFLKCNRTRYCKLGIFSAACPIFSSHITKPPTETSTKLCYIFEETRRCASDIFNFFINLIGVPAIMNNWA